MLVDAGATIGGTVAAGLSGPGRFRYGGIRDFFLGVQFIGGDAELLRAGGKVVKNAAGFDLPKFLVGSLGRFGVMTELTFKVFPKPIATQTLCVRCGSHGQAVERMAKAAASRWELDAIDYRPDQQTIYLRVAGPPQVNESIEREICSVWGDDVSQCPSADAFWQSVRELNWSGNDSIAVKVPTTPRQFPGLYASLADNDVLQCHLSVAGNVLWILLQTSDRLTTLDKELRSRGISGLVVRGDGATPLVGNWVTSEMQTAVKAALDPPARFPNLLTNTTAATER